MNRLSAEENELFDAIVKRGVVDPRLANCYECRFRGNLPGSAQSCCTFPNGQKPNLILAIQMPMVHKKVPMVYFYPKANPNWTAWPLDFDPVWLQFCFAFKNKETK